MRFNYIGSIMNKNTFKTLGSLMLLIVLVVFASCDKTGKKNNVNRQHFNVVGIESNYETDEVQYDVDVFFTQPVESEKALKLFESSFVEKYGVTASPVNDRRYVFQINNVKRGSSDSNLELVLDGKALNVAKKFSQTLTVCAKDTFRVDNVLVDQQQCNATITFTEPLKQGNLDGFITLEPEIGYRADIVGNKLVLYFDRSTVYSWYLDEINLTINAGIKDINGHSLGEEFTQTMDLRDLMPKVRWTEDGVIIPEADDPVVYFDALCLNSVTLRIVRILDDNILSFYQDNDLDETYGIRKAGRLEKKVKITLDNPCPTQWKTFPIVLNDYIDVKKGDMYQLILDFGPVDYTYATEESSQINLEDEQLEAKYWAGNAGSSKNYPYDGDWNDPLNGYYYNWVSCEKNVLVSDLAVTAKMGDDSNVDVYVFSISDAEPVSGANVTAYNFQRQQIESGRTDGKGHVRLTCANRPAFLVTKDRNGGKSVIKLNDGSALSYSKFNTDGESVERGVAAFAYSNRGVWRPGDELQLNLMVTSSGTNLPADYPVVMEVYDASSRLYEKQTNNSPVGGIYSYNVQTSPSDETGLWKANFKVGNSVITKYLRIETVKPNRLDIRFNTPEVISLSHSESVGVHAQWLNGLEVKDLPTTVDVKVSAGTTSFKNFPTYTFVNESECYYPTEYALYFGKLDSKGNAIISMDPLSDLSSDQMMRATFTTKVFEEGGDFSIVSSSAMLSPHNRYVGVEMPATESKWGEYYFTNRNWRFPVAIVKETGELCKSTVALEYNLYKVDGYWWWSSEDAYDLQKYVNGSYKRPMMNGMITCSTGTTEITLNVPDNKWGLYLLVITDQQGGNTFAKTMRFDWDYTTLHASGEGDAPMQIALNSTKDAYAVGENIIVNFPSNDKAKALVTVESNDQVLQSIYLDKLGTEGKVEIKATQEMVPNIYVYVSLIQPRDADNDMPVRMYGVLPIKVEDTKLQLHPVLNIPETSNTNKTIQINVKEADGKPMAYTLAIVDEGILSLTNFATPDPYAYFNAKQALKVRTWDNYNYIIDAFTGEFGNVFATGGDGYIDHDVVLDNRFKAYAVTMGPYELKQGQSHQYEFEVPQCSGALRFMVIAKGNDKAYGATGQKMTVVDPINLYASAPRVVAPDDELKLKIQVLAPTMKGKNLNVTVNNKNLTPVTDYPASVKVNNDGEAMVVLDVKVPETLGVATMDVTVTGDGYSAHSVTEMPIRIPNAEHRATYTQVVEPNATDVLNFNVDGIEGSASGDVMVASLIPLNIFGRLDYLTTYPYGCLEQVVSAAFPQLYLNYFADLSAERKDNIRAAVEEGIASLKSYQRSDFSMTNWPGGLYVNPWTELYALHFLAEAKTQGFEVPQYMIDGMVQYQAGIAKQWRNNPDYKQGETIQAYRLFVLALAGSPEMGALNRFKELEKNYTLSEILTAATYSTVGKKNLALQLLPFVDETAMLSDYYTTFGSKPRDLAFRTYTEMVSGADEATVQAHVNELCDVMNSDEWLDTQTAGFVLYVLGKYAEKVDATNSPISASIRFNGEERSVNTNRGSAAYDVTPVMGSNKVEITNNSNQKITTKVFVKSSKPEHEMEESGYFINMTVRYVDKNGNPVDPSVLNKGTDFTAVVTVSNPSDYQVTELSLAYYLASGWELVNERLNEDGQGFGEAKHIDLRDDRAYYFFDLMPRTSKTFRLKLNATYEGVYMLPAVRCEDMYNNAIYYVVPARKVEVR